MIDACQAGVLCFLGLCYCVYAIGTQMIAARNVGEYERILREIYTPIVKEIIGDGR